MCEMLNLFVPVRRATVGPAIRGLELDAADELQRDFKARYADEPGTFLSAAGAKFCLCGFDDWPALYALARDLLDRNHAPYVALIHFWSGDTYRLADRAVDIDDPVDCTPIELGEVVVARAEPPERRRHRQVLRALTRSVGAPVTLTLRSGKTVHGTLLAFDPDSEVGQLDDHVVIAAQVHDVATTAV